MLRRYLPPSLKIVCFEGFCFPDHRLFPPPASFRLLMLFLHTDSCLPESASVGLFPCFSETVSADCLGDARKSVVQGEQARKWYGLFPDCRNPRTVSCLLTAYLSRTGRKSIRGGAKYVSNRYRDDGNTLWQFSLEHVSPGGTSVLRPSVFLDSAWCALLVLLPSVRKQGLLKNSCALMLPRHETP